MKSTLFAVTLIGCMCLSIILIGQLDPTYQTVKHSKESSQHLGKHPLSISPDTEQFNVMLDNHWKISPVFSRLEDVFYPFRKWQHHMGNAIKFTYDDHALRQQLDSITRVEKATKVRAKRAYFFAKRRNFRDEALNNDFINKKNQWIATFKERLQRQVYLMNGDYNNVWSLFFVLTVVMSGLMLINHPLNSIVGVVGIMGSLFIGSYYRINDVAIPFHWFLVAWLMIFSGYPIKFKSIPFIRYIGLGIPILVASSSTIGAIIGLAMMQLIWAYPKIKPGLFWLLWLHPLGTWVVLNQKKRPDALIVGWGLAILALIGFNGLGITMLFTSPIAYLGQVGIIVNAIVLMMSSACILSDNGTKKRQDIIIMGLAIAAVIGLKEVTQSPLFSWSFSFVWNPIVQWGSILAICACQYRSWNWRKRAKVNSVQKAPSIDGPIVAE